VTTEPGPVNLDVLAPPPGRVERCVEAVVAAGPPVPSLVEEIWTVGRYALVAALGGALLAWGCALWPGKRLPSAPPVPVYVPIPSDLLLSARGTPDGP